MPQNLSSSRKRWNWLPRCQLHTIESILTHTFIKVLSKSTATALMGGNKIEGSQRPAKARATRARAPAEIDVPATLDRRRSSNLTPSASQADKAAILRHQAVWATWAAHQLSTKARTNDATSSSDPIATISTTIQDRATTTQLQPLRRSRILQNQSVVIIAVVPPKASSPQANSSQVQRSQMHSGFTTLMRRAGQQQEATPSR